MAKERQMQVVDIRSSSGITTNESNEHQRNWQQYQWDRLAHTAGNNIDRTRSHLNFEIAQGGIIQPIDCSKSINQRMKESLEERGITDPNEKRKVKNIRTMINFIFGGSRETMRQLAYGDQQVDYDSEHPDNSNIQRCEDIEKWAKDIYDFVCRKYGEENIVGFYVHCDESNPHCHCSVLPVTPDNKLSWKYWFGYTMEAGIQKLEELHTELSAVNAKWGLERGEDIHKTGAKHVSTEEYRRQAMELEHRIESGKSELQQIYDEINRCKKKIKAFETMISNLTAQKDSLEQQISEIRKQLNASPDASNDELIEKLTQLNALLQDVTAKLDSRRKDLDDVKKQLLEAQQEKEKLKQLNQSLRNHSIETLNAMEAKTRLDMTSLGMSELSKGFKELMPTLSSTQMQKLSHSLGNGSSVPVINMADDSYDFGHDDIFDVDVLNTIAERTEEVISCATLLFYGFVDKATQYSESHGGKSSPGTGWGRDDNDDDYRWRRRCMAHAARMLGGHGRGRKR